MNLEVDERMDGFFIYDVNHQIYLKARFHTRKEAEDYIKQKVIKFNNFRNGSPRAAGYWTLHGQPLSSDMAGDNERIIRAMQLNG